ncbi:MAG: hypothetical protein Fur0044_22680 [Anaerolineae bacterium]
MTQTLTLPSLTTIPNNIEEQLRQLLQTPREPGLGEWLFELIKSSGHLSTPDALRWRVVALVWLAAEFDTDKAWPYLMWLNTGQPAISEHLAEILSDAANDLDCHVELVNWMAKAKDERLITFFSDFHPLPARYNMPTLVRRLLNHPTAPETGVWLAAYCRDTAGSTNPNLRPWRLLAAAWYATCFDTQAGLAYLRELSGGSPTLAAVDNKILTDMAGELNCMTSVTQWLATCPDPMVKTMLKDFGHPDLPTFAAAIFQQSPDYQHLTDSVRHAEADAQAFQHAVKLLEQAGVSLKNARLLDLACGPLAAQTLLFNSAGYKILGADLHIPPAYLPTASLAQRLFQRGKYVKAWETATAPYYQALAQHAGLKLKWNGVKIELADLTRLPFPDQSFEAIICLNHLQHAPDVESLLAEAARVLQPGGVLVANIIPYPALTGAFAADGASPWSHLRGTANTSQPNPVILNRWRERQYRLAFEKFFQVEQWQAEANPNAMAQLTPTVRAELADYDEAELTCQQVVVIARKR